MSVALVTEAVAKLRGRDALVASDAESIILFRRGEGAASTGVGWFCNCLYIVTMVFHESSHNLFEQIQELEYRLLA